MPDRRAGSTDAGVNRVIEADRISDPGAFVRLRVDDEVHRHADHAHAVGLVDGGHGCRANRATSASVGWGIDRLGRCVRRSRKHVVGLAGTVCLPAAVLTGERGVVSEARRSSS